MGKLILIVLIVTAVYSLLYLCGCLVIHRKRAVVFISTKRGNQATFTGCTGYMKRIIRFRENKNYRFILDCALNKGKMEIELLDTDKQQLMCLNSQNQSANIPAEKNKRYTLIFRFRSATGKYILDCD